MTWAPDSTKATNMPGMPAMAEAYGRWINEQGGINGHELRVLTCNEGNSAAGAAACAREAVREGAVAVVGSYSQHGRAFMAILEAANIPYIGGYGLSDEEFTSHLSYPVNGGQIALLAGNGMQLADSCERVSLVRPDTVAGDALPPLLNSGLAQGSHQRAIDIPAADDAGEYAAVAHRSRSRAGEEGGCVTAALGERTAHFFDSFRRLPSDGRQVRVSSVLGSVDQLLVDRTGGASGPFEGAYITGWYPDAGDPRWDPMKQVIQQHAFGDNRIDSGGRRSPDHVDRLHRAAQGRRGAGRRGRHRGPGRARPGPRPARGHRRAHPRTCAGATRTCWARRATRGS